MRKTRPILFAAVLLAAGSVGVAAQDSRDLTGTILLYRWMKGRA